MVGVAERWLRVAAEKPGDWAEDEAGCNRDVTERCRAENKAGGAH